MFIESSKDILFIVLAFCALWFTIFVCWFIYYLIIILRQVQGVVDEVKGKLISLEKLILLIKEKFERSSSYFSIFAELIKQGVKIFFEKKKKTKVQK